MHRRQANQAAPAPPVDKPASRAVWRLLESKADFVEGMEEARKSFERGEGEPYKHKVPRPER